MQTAALVDDDGQGPKLNRPGRNSTLTKDVQKAEYAFAQITRQRQRRATRTMMMVGGQETWANENRGEHQVTSHPIFSRAPPLCVAFPSVRFLADGRMIKLLLNSICIPLHVQGSPLC
jgi:hypothetical protein